MLAALSWTRKATSIDHRRAPRFLSPSIVGFYWDGSTPAAHPIRDISAAGLYMVTDERWPQGTIITITVQRTSVLKIRSMACGYISVLSRVVRSGEDGVGLAFFPPSCKSAGDSSCVAKGLNGERALAGFLKRIKLDQSGISEVRTR